MDFHNKIITKKPEETAEIGASLARYLTRREEPHILCLYGQLGSGKTTFTQGFARGLGITSRLLSPTFIIVRRYQIPKKDFFLHHVDLYRLNSASEMQELGLSEIFSDLASYMVIEWAEKLEDMLPKNRTDIYFSVTDDEKHKIIIK